MEGSKKWNEVVGVKKCDPPLEKHLMAQYMWDSGKFNEDRIPIIFRDYIIDLCLDEADNYEISITNSLSKKELKEKCHTSIEAIITQFNSKYQIDDDNPNKEEYISIIRSFLKSIFDSDGDFPRKNGYLFKSIKVHIQNQDETLLEIRDEVKCYNSLSDEIKIKIGEELVAKYVIDTKAFKILDVDRSEYRIENIVLKESLDKLQKILIDERKVIERQKYDYLS